METVTRVKVNVSNARTRDESVIEGSFPDWHQRVPPHRQVLVYQCLYDVQVMVARHRMAGGRLYRERELGHHWEINPPFHLSAAGAKDRSGRISVLRDAAIHVTMI